MAKKRKPRVPRIEFDELQMYFGEPFVVKTDEEKNDSQPLFKKKSVKTKNLIIYQPTIGNIVEMGETKFFSSLNALVSNTTQYRLMLWDLGMDWNTTSDYELFIMLHKSISDDVSQLLFHLDFSNFELYTQELNGEQEVVLYSKKDDILINEKTYNYISQYLQNVFQIKPEEKITHDPVLKRLYIDKDRRQQEREAKKGTEDSSNMKALISACVNHAGFKHSLKDLKEVGVCEFYDSVQRLQIYESTTALLKGMYSGFIDGKKIKPEDYNFMKTL